MQIFGCLHFLQLLFLLFSIKKNFVIWLKFFLFILKYIKAKVIAYISLMIICEKMENKNGSSFYEFYFIKL